MSSLNQLKQGKRLDCLRSLAGVEGGGKFPRPKINVPYKIMTVHCKSDIQLASINDSAGGDARLRDNESVGVNPDVTPCHVTRPHSCDARVDDCREICVRCMPSSATDSSTTLILISPNIANQLMINYILLLAPAEGHALLFQSITNKTMHTLHYTTLR